MSAHATPLASERVEPRISRLDWARLTAALDAHPKAKLVAIVHAETSTGAHQPLDGFAGTLSSHFAIPFQDLQGLQGFACPHGRLGLA